MNRAIPEYEFVSPREPTVERLDLRFLAESEPRSKPARRVWISCLVISVVTGVGSWASSRYLLRQELREQLGKSNTVEGLLALESLSQLDADALSLARGLENPNPEVAKAAYRALDDRITAWQSADTSESAQEMQELADQLAALPTSISLDSKILASSLASRLFSFCLEKNDPGLDPLMKISEQVVRKAGGGLPASADTTGTEQFDSSTSDIPSSGDESYSSNMEPPPPLPELGQTNLADLDASKTNAFYTAGMSDSVGATADQVDSVAASNDALASTPNSPLRSRAETTETSYSLSDSDDTDATPIPHELAIGELTDSHYALGDSDAALQLQDAPAVPSVPVAMPTVAKSIGDHGPQSLSLESRVEIQGMTSKTDLQLVRLLSSRQPKYSEAAVYELRSRNWPENDINLAIELSQASEIRRLELVTLIATQLDEPHNWLLWMAEDGTPAVRRKAISHLHPMADLEVERRLRRLLGRENDESVSQAIRQVLIARGQTVSVR